GRTIGTIPVQEATPERITQMMIGSDWKRTEWQRDAELGPVRLSVRNLNSKGLLRDVSLELRGGEVLGLAGLLGSGRTELLRAIFGLDPIDSGEILVDGTPQLKPNPISMKATGIGLTPEDRKKQGLVLVFPVEDNLTLASLHRVSSMGVLNPGKEKVLAETMVDNLAIKTARLDVKTRTLSGGNQQKVVIGNWLNTLPQVLMMDEPTRGIDIQAKEQIFALVRDLARQGLAVLFVSSEIEEVLDVADRILVMNQGRITHSRQHDEVDLEQLMALVMEEYTE
ncbi:MAG: sugar ABC transporter ATP-binding protein, partial [Anaerolineae bacterium]|nr:sugar ABC transporter ATP-binding protein [Anaerolineae bacterium]MCB0237863.1 sugar ABC transporter ATP-binding protein [Anaerolineae bacterium]